MKKILFKEKRRLDEIYISDVEIYQPIFAKDIEGKLCGMLVNEGEKG